MLQTLYYAKSDLHDEAATLERRMESLTRRGKKPNKVLSTYQDIISVIAHIEVCMAQLERGCV